MSSLYLTYFGLASPPFSITPDPSFFFEGKDRGVFIAGLLHATLQAEGIVVVIGEVGSGKTLMSRILLSRLPKYVDTVYLPNPAFSRDEIIEVIARDLGVEAATPGHGFRLEALQQELIKRHAMSRKVVVLIDEAHAMPADSIEEIRRLSNLETDNCKLVQVVLCGQPELDTMLEAPHLRQVRDRVVYRLNLAGLSREDARSYIDHRLRVAGWRGSRMFSWYAEWLLLCDAKGRARRINILADKALLAAFADNKKQVLARHVRRAIRDAGANFATTGPVRRRPWGLMTAWAASVAFAVLAALWFTHASNQQSSLAVSQSLQAVPAISANKTDPPLPTEGPSSVTPKAGDSVTPPAPVSASADAASDSAAPPSASLPQEEIKPEAVAPGPSPLADIGRWVRQSQAYAQEQSALGHFAIRLAAISFVDKALAVAFIASVEKLLPPGQVHVRRFLDWPATDPEQANYVIYYGSFPTHEAARLALNDLPEKLHKDKPTIRTWKDISDAPWSL